MQAVRHLLASVVPLALAPLALAQGGSMGAKNPFSPPDATVHYAPDRTYDLQDITLDLNVDYPRRRLDAVATNRLLALRDGATSLRFHAGEFTKIERVDLDGRPAKFVRDAEGILVGCAPTKAHEAHVVVVAYHVSNADAKGPIPGFHFHEPAKNDPSKAGFWTNGETSDTRNWAVAWDYPNDFATSTTRTTVPRDWEVVGNGVRMSDKVSGNRRTVVWRMSQPHATYLLSVVAGPLGIRTDSWRGLPLYYVAPRGMEAKRDSTVEHTKDMLSFFSDRLGVKYPWPKYAEDFTYDFGGGQENVSATTFGLFLTGPRDGDHPSDELLSHEMGHQWFGDYVTCKDWGEIWLNESFATFMQMSYTLHRRGAYASQRDREAASQGYFGESRRYKRPMETDLYRDPGVMFDQHTYPKGGVLLMSLPFGARRQGVLRGAARVPDAPRRLARRDGDAPAGDYRRHRREPAPVVRPMDPQARPSRHRLVLELRRDRPRGGRPRPTDPGHLRRDADLRHPREGRPDRRRSGRPEPDPSHEGRRVLPGRLRCEARRRPLRPRLRVPP